MHGKFPLPMNIDDAKFITDSVMTAAADFAKALQATGKLDVDAVLDEYLASVAAIHSPGGDIQANHLAFLFSMAKVGALDNKDPKVIKLKKNWGSQIQKRRMARDLSVRITARKTYVDDKTIVAIENGAADISRYPFVILLFEAFLVELDAEKEKTSKADL